MNSDRSIEELDSADGNISPGISRREFLQGVGGGIVVLFLVGGDVFAQRGGRGLPSDFNAFLRISEDGRVTCFTGKIEMGQGIITSLAQMLADEMDVALGSVDMVMGDTGLCPYDQGTFGSMSTRSFGPPLRAAGAEARTVLLELASEQLGIPVEQFVVENGVVLDKTDKSKSVTYAQLAKGREIVKRAKSVEVKTPASFKVIGKPMTRRDAHEKVTGEAKYAGDMRPAGMLYAKILRHPAHGATLKTVDTSEASKIEGVQVVRDGNLVAVLHEHPDVAEKALATIKAEFSTPEPAVDDVTIFDHLLEVAPEGQDVSRGGDLAKGQARATELFDNTYLNSYVAHAPMEPHTAVVEIEDKKATVWASTQSPFGAKSEVAQALGLAPEDVRVMPAFVGGGFGGKTRNLQVVEAARLAKLAGKPVQVAWTRSEEFFDDSFRPAAIIKIKSGITDSGEIAFWDYHVYYAGTRGSEHFYNIADSATVSHSSGWGSAPGTHPFATGAWRGPGNNTNTFGRESHIDVMAAKAGADPVEFRLKNLRDDKMKGVLNAAAAKFGWGSAKPSGGRGFGVALGFDSGTRVCELAEVEVDEKTGAVQVKRIVSVQNMGLCINPEGAKIQMEGCVTMGLGYALTEEIHFKGGDILDRNFGDYQIPRFSWLPKIETIIIEDSSSPAQGGGEPAIITSGAVIANAIYSATGVRLFQLPMTPARVLEALKKRGH